MLLEAAGTVFARISVLKLWFFITFFWWKLPVREDENGHVHMFLLDMFNRNFFYKKMRKFMFLEINFH